MVVGEGSLVSMDERWTAVIDIISMDEGFIGIGKLAAIGT